MESPKIMLLAFCIIITPQIILMVQANNIPLVPAIYLFGSSSLDGGNNNNLTTDARADRWPYAIDFGGKQMGRFSNAQNLADFAAMNLGLPSAPAYLGLIAAQRKQIKTGINYASGACGILNTTRVGDCLWLGKQIDYFTSTVQEDLANQMNKYELRHHLAKSIFFIFAGVNDYGNKTNGNITARFTGPDFADFLFQKLTQQLQRLYNLGARKFVLHGISRCTPDDHNMDTCNARYYLDRLPGKIQFFQRSFPGSFFTMYDTAAVYQDMVVNHAKYGIEDYENYCFVTKPTIKLCPDRTKYNFFDEFHHQTNVSCKIAMDGCFNGTFCTPYNLHQLAKIHHPRD